MIEKATFDKVFAGMVLPVKPAVAVNGAMIELIEETYSPVSEGAFFGGYAEDLLADIGFDMVEEQSQPGLRARKV